MELSKRIAYLKGLMEGLGISDSSPEGKVLLCMSDILGQMADEIEENTHALAAVTDYIDELEDGGDPFDDIDTYEYGFDPDHLIEPELFEDELSGDEDDYVEEHTPEEYERAIRESEEEESEDNEAPDDEDNEAPDDQYRRLLENITSDPDYTDSDIGGHDEQALVEKLKNMVEQEIGKAPAEPLAEEDEAAASDEDMGDMILGLNCPFCHEDITFTDKDIVNGEFDCPVCGNKLTIMM